MARRLIGLDLGAYSVKLVRLEAGKETPKFEIVNVVEEVLPLDQEEKEPEDLQEKQRQAVLKLAALGLLDAESFAIGLDAHESHMRTMKVPPLDNRKIDAVLPGLLETEVPFDVDDMIVSWHRIIPIGEESDKRDSAETVDIRIAFGRKPAIARTLQILQPAAIDPRIMHLTSAATFELVRELPYAPFEGSSDTLEPSHLVRSPLSAIVDFGHRSTNLCIFDKHGIKHSRTFLKGGKYLDEKIALLWQIPLSEAVSLKHNKVDLAENVNDEESSRVSEVAKVYFDEIFDDIARTFIVTKASGLGEVVSVALVGGACNTINFHSFMTKKFDRINIRLIPPGQWLPTAATSPSTALSLAYALSGLQVHAKDNRFNFRKDEFAWRGNLDFMRAKSAPLILWSLAIVCALTVLWSASSMVLDKENQYIENRLKTVCSQILAQKNVAPKKCLTLMKEQIASHIDFGIPEFTATDLYVKTAELVPKDLPLTISELDVTEKKVRFSAETTSFAKVDEIVASLMTIPCLVKVERGRAQQVGNVVKFTLSSDLDCNAAKSQPVSSPEPAKNAPSSQEKSSPTS